jgi:hypothetical protein
MASSVASGSGSPGPKSSTPKGKRARGSMGSPCQVVNLEEVKSDSINFMRNEVISKMKEDPAFVQAAWGAVQKTKSALLVQDCSHGDTTNPSASSIKAKGSQAIKIRFVTDVTPITHQELLVMMEKDPCFLNYITVFLCQLREDMRWPDVMRVDGVASTVLRARHAATGARCTVLDKPKVIVEGRWIWKTMGSYAPTFDMLAERQRLASITTWDGIVGDVPLDTYIDTTWVLVDNHSDMTARFEKGKFPPVYCKVFFSQDPPGGPFRFESFQGVKSGEKFTKYVQGLYDGWKEVKQTDAAKKALASDTQNQHADNLRQSAGTKAKVATKKYFEKKKAAASCSYAA